MNERGSYQVVAHNTATASANKIHDDAVARRYGFGGGLVPGVDVYAYMTHPPAAAWGIEWLARGSMRARFLVPVYEGDKITVDPVEVVLSPNRDTMRLEVRNTDGVLCATGEAGLASQPTAPPSVERWPGVEPAASPLPASPEALPPGAALALATHRFRADRAGEYLDDIREQLPLYADRAVAHPGWLLRDANYVLSSNVVLGPWIHVESVTHHHDIVHDGDTVDARAVVTKEWEHKGHRFVELDVLLLADDHRPVARITHTAIYQPRPPTG